METISIRRVHFEAGEVARKTGDWLDVGTFDLTNLVQ
jgi:hypothetical protein